MMSEGIQKTILLVEDEAILAMMETDTLSNYGYKVITANTGEKAVKAVQDKSDIDLVLMDINLGKGMDGTQAASIILEKNNIPLIFLSSHTEREVVERTEGITSYGYIVKNSGETVLIASIKMAFRLFESRMKEQENEEFRKRVFDSSVVPIAIMDSQTHQIVDCNPAAVSIYRFYSRGETLGKTPQDVSAPLQYDGSESKEKAQFYIDKALNQGQVVFEWLHRRPDGGLWDAEVHLMSFESKGQRFLQFTLQDITERKKAEKALQKQRALDLVTTKLLARIVSDNNAEVDAIVNESLGEIACILGADLAMMVQFDDNRTTYSTTHEWCAPGVESRRQNYQSVSLGTSPWVEKKILEGEAVLVNRLNDAPVEAEVSKRRWELSGYKSFIQVPFRGQEGSILGSMGLFGVTHEIEWSEEDVSRLSMLADSMSNALERKKLEDGLNNSRANLKALIESTKDLIWSVDLDYRLMTYNSVLDDHFRINYGTKAFIGAGPKDLIPPYKADEWPKLYKRALTDGSYSLEYNLPDGRILELTFNPIIQAKKIIGISVFGKDITERKRAEIALKASEFRYRDIFENAINGIYQTSPEGNVLVVNPAMVEILGYTSAADFISQINESTQDIWVDTAKRSHYYQKLEEKKELKNFECEFRRCDSSIVWVLLNSRCVYDVNGKLQYYESFVSDISELKSAEQKQRESEALYHSLYKNAPVGIFYSTISGKIVRVNDEYARMMGYSSPEEVKEIVNQSTIAETIYMRADERSLFLDKLLLVPGKWMRSEKQFRKKNGTPMTANVVIRVLPDNPDHLEGFLEDITERRLAEESLKASEARYRLITDFSLDWESYYDASNKLVYVNSGAQRITGYTVEEMLSGHLGLKDLCYEEEMNKYYDMTERLFVKKEIVQNIQYKIKHKDGSPRYISLSGIPIMINDGIYAGVRTSIRDKTELAKLEEEKKMKDNYIVSLQKFAALSSLTTSIAHEIRQPLQLIKVITETLLLDYRKSDNLSEADLSNQENLTELSNGVLRIEKIISNMYQLFNTNTKIKLVFLNINTVIEKLIDKYQIKLKGVPIHIDLNLQANLLEVYGDAILIEEVVSNILNNAVDALNTITIPDKRIKIQTWNDSNKVMVEIGNNGPGIQEYIKDQIFDPLFSSKKGSESMGMGLFLVKTIVNAMNGSIELFKNEGNETAFRIAFPGKGSVP